MDWDIHSTDCTCKSLKHEKSKEFGYEVGERGELIKTGPTDVESAVGHECDCQILFEDDTMHDAKIRSLVMVV